MDNIDARHSPAEPGVAEPGTAQHEAGEAAAKRFGQIVAFLTALVTLLIVGITYLQSDAGTLSQRAFRLASRYSLEMMDRRVNGDAKVNYEFYGVYNAWDEYDSAYLSALERGDDAAARRYLALRDRMAGLTPLLAPPYFDAETRSLDLARYEVDQYILEVTTLQQRFAAASTEGSAWGSKAGAYIVHLTLLGLVLFVFGLSSTVSSRMAKRIFLILGLGLAAVVIVWAVVVYVRPVPVMPPAAIDAYARGDGLLYQGRDTEAVAAFTEAISLHPNYADAYAGRGTAQADLEQYREAAADYEQARVTGGDSAGLLGDLGFTYYLEGRFDEAIAVNREALKLGPDELWIRFNQGLTLLVAGQRDAAQREYADALALAAQQVATARAAGQEPPSDLWWSLETSSDDLDLLMQAIDGYEVGGVSPVNTIVEPEAVRAAAHDLFARMRSLAVALEYTGQPPAGELTAQIGDLGFAMPVYDDEGELTDYDVRDTFEFGVQSIAVLFDYEGMSDGQQVLIKIYADGEEEPSWRADVPWELGASGSAQYELGFAYSDLYVVDSGEYVVELYVDSQLAQRGSFVVLAEGEQ